MAVNTIDKLQFLSFIIYIDYLILPLAVKTSDAVAKSVPGISFALTYSLLIFSPFFSHRVIVKLVSSCFSNIFPAFLRILSSYGYHHHAPLLV